MLQDLANEFFRILNKQKYLLVARSSRLGGCFWLQNFGRWWINLQLNNKNNLNLWKFINIHFIILLQNSFEYS